MQGVNPKNSNPHYGSLPELRSARSEESTFTTGPGKKTVIAEVKSAATLERELRRHPPSAKQANMISKQFTTYVLHRCTDGRKVKLTDNDPLADNKGVTALMVAARNPDGGPLVKAILKNLSNWNGLNINAVNHDGHTAYDLAVKTGKQEVADLLYSAGGRGAEMIPKDQRINHRRVYEAAVEEAQARGLIIKRGDNLAFLGRRAVPAELSASSHRRATSAPPPTPTAPSNPTINPTRRRP